MAFPQVVRKTIPEMPKLAENILTLQQSLAAEREVWREFFLPTLRIAGHKAASLFVR